MSNSLHSFKSNESIKKYNDLSLSFSRKQTNEISDDNVTYSIFLNDSDIEPNLRNNSIDNNSHNKVLSSNSNIIPNSRLYKLVMSNDDIGSNNNDSKNYASLVTLSTGVLNSTYNSESNINLSVSNNNNNNNIITNRSENKNGSSNNSFLVNVQSSPLDDIINSSNEYFSTSSNVHVYSNDNALSGLAQPPPVNSQYKKRPSIVNTISTDASSTYRYYYNDDHNSNPMVPTIEEAVQLLKKDYIRVPRPVRIKSEQSLSSIEFEPHEFRIIKKSHYQSNNSTPTNKSNKINQIGQPLRNSLIDHLIIPSSNDNSAISTRFNPNTNVQVLKSIKSPNNRVISTSKNNDQINTAMQSPTYRTARMTNSQMDLAIKIPVSNNSDFEPESKQPLSSQVLSSIPTPTQIASTSDLPPSPTYDSESDCSNDEDNDIWNNNGIYSIQHIDSLSIQSYDSLGKDYKDEDEDIFINDMFSTSKIMMLIFIGIIMPPLFFIVGMGGNNGMLSDYYLLKLMMKHPQRLGLLQGFIWDVDLKWFRELCFWLGCIEMFLILACVATGFGVGLTR